LVNSPGLSAMRGQARPEQPAMIGRHPRRRLPQPLYHRGRILDAGEREHEHLRGYQP